MRLLESRSALDDFRAESGLRIAVEQWMFQQSSGEYDSALGELGKILLRRHADTWLSDVLHSPSNPRTERFLVAALRANLAGNADEALKQARLAKTGFARLGNAPLLALSSHQELYALRRKSRAPECLAAVQSALPTMADHHYAWIEAQVYLEQAACHGMLSDFSASERLGLAALELTSKAHFPILKLRALGLLASLDIAQGKLLESWKANADGLAAFWSTTFPPERGFQFYTDLDFLAEHESYWHLAAALEYEAIGMLTGRKRYDYEAIARMKRAVACIRIGDLGCADHEFQQARKLMALLPAAPRSLYETDSEIALASLEVNEDKVDSAATRLGKLESAVAQARNFTVQSAYAKAMAELERHRGNTAEEIHYLKQVADIGHSGMRSLKSAEERWQWEQEIDWANRRLMEIELSRPHDPLTALAHWESMRSFDSSTSGQEAIRRLRAKVEKMPLTLLSFVSLPRRTVLWVSNSGKYQEFSIPIAADELANEVDQFRRQCSNPEVPIEKVKDTGSRLYSQLIAPAKAALNHEQIGILPDDVLSDLPWAALSDEEGKYLNEEHVLVTIPSLLSMHRSGPTNMGVNSSTLIAVPGAVFSQGTALPPLPDATAEARFIAGLFPRSRVLEGTKANRSELVPLLSTVSLFHFAGHASTNDLGGELLLEGSRDGDSLSAASIDRLHFRNNPLIVLAACSTAVVNTGGARNPFGLVRAFLSAGSSQVLASRWNVDSESTDSLMRIFYRELREGQAPEVALQHARMQLSQRPESTHPFYWSGFELFTQ